MGDGCRGDDAEGDGDFALLATLPLLSSAPAGAPCSSWTSCASCGWKGPSAAPFFHRAAAVGSSSCTSSLTASCLVFLAVASFPSLAALLHILLPQWPTQQRAAGFCFFFLAQITNDLAFPRCLPFHYSFAFFLDLWLWLMHSLLFLPLQQQLACSPVSPSRPPLSLISLSLVFQTSDKVRPARHSSDK